MERTRCSKVEQFVMMKIFIQLTVDAFPVTSKTSQLEQKAWFAKVSERQVLRRIFIKPKVFNGSTFRVFIANLGY
jgi:hypothetical protein